MLTRTSNKVRPRCLTNSDTRGRYEGLANVSKTPENRYYFLSDPFTRASKLTFPNKIKFADRRILSLFNCDKADRVKH